MGATLSHPHSKVNGMQAVLGVPDSFAKLAAPVRARILLAAAVILMTVTAAEGLVNVRNAQLDARKDVSQPLVEASVNSMWFYYNQFMAGKITEDAAQKAAYGVLNQMVYDRGQNYIFAYSYEKPNTAILRINMLRPDLIGQDRWNARDSEGNYYVRMGIAAAKSGGGFYAYLWDAGGTSPRSRSKLSYAAPFAPWHLMIGTGQYVDDILTEFWDRLSFLFSISALCLATGTTFLTWLLGGRRERFTW